MYSAGGGGAYDHGILLLPERRVYMYKQWKFSVARIK